MHLITYFGRQLGILFQSMIMLMVIAEVMWMNPQKDTMFRYEPLSFLGIGRNIIYVRFSIERALTSIASDNLIGFGYMFYFF